MTTTPAVSVIIPSYNTRSLTLQCVESVLHHAPPLACEVIIVDNASRDGSADAILVQFPDVTLLRNSENLGFARAVNQGVERSRGDLVLMLNSDAYVQDHTLEHMAHYAHEHPRIGALGCRIVNPDGSHQPSAGRVPTLLLEISDQFLSPLKLLPRSWRRNCVHSDDFRSIVDVDWMAGSCLLLRREALNAVGALDEQFALGEEDIDLGIRLKQAGWGVVYYPHATVVHLGGRSRPFNAEAVDQFLLGRYRLYRKHLGQRWARRYRCIMLASMGLRWLVSWIGERFTGVGATRRAQAYAVRWSKIRGW